VTIEHPKYSRCLIFWISSSGNNEAVNVQYTVNKIPLFESLGSILFAKQHSGLSNLTQSKVRRSIYVLALPDVMSLEITSVMQSMIYQDVERIYLVPA
jgi:hypothetical protein